MPSLVVEPKLFQGSNCYQKTSIAELQSHLDHGYPAPAVVIGLEEQVTIAVYIPEANQCAYFTLEEKVTKFLKMNYGIKVGHKLLSINYAPENFTGAQDYILSNTIPLIAESICNNRHDISAIKETMDFNEFESIPRELDSVKESGISDYIYPDTNPELELDLGIQTNEEAESKSEPGFDAFEGREINAAYKPIEDGYKLVAKYDFHSRMPIILTGAYAVMTLSLLNTHTGFPPIWTTTWWGTASTIGLAVLGIPIMVYQLYSLYLLFSKKVHIELSWYYKKKLMIFLLLLTAFAPLSAFMWILCTLSSFGIEV